MTTASPFGLDVSTFRGGAPGLDPTFELQDGPINVVEVVARRFLTPNGTLEGDPDFGHDIRQYIQARQNAITRARARAALRSEAMKEQRVRECAVEITYVGNVMKVTAIVTVDAGGVFSLTISASELAKPDVQIALLRAA
jgi:phage baseplate assembly protein W